MDSRTCPRIVLTQLERCKTNVHSISSCGLTHSAHLSTRIAHLILEHSNHSTPYRLTPPLWKPELLLGAGLFQKAQRFSKRNATNLPQSQLLAFGRFFCSGKAHNEGHEVHLPLGEREPNSLAEGLQGIVASWLLGLHSEFAN